MTLGSTRPKTTSNSSTMPAPSSPHLSDLSAMPDKNSKQQQLNKDYADYLIEHETAKTRGEALGTFLEWRHKNDRDGIKIVERKK